MARGVKDLYVREQIAVRIKMGDRPADIAREMRVGVPLVYDVRSKDLGISGRVDMSNRAEPDAAQAKVRLAMTGEEVAKFTGRDEAVVMAGLYTTERMEASLKTRVLKAIAENGPFDDVRSLMRFMRQPGDNYDSHQITHILKASLAKQGLIRYTESRNHGATGRGSVATKITATNRGYAEAGINPNPAKIGDKEPGHVTTGSSRAAHAIGRDRTEKRYHADVAVGGPIIRSYVQPVSDVRGEPVSAPAPVAAPEVYRPRYPILEALRGSFAKRAAADALASRYADAAAMLEHDDPSEAKRLMDKALAASPQSLTGIEKEYLAFAEAHEK